MAGVFFFPGLSQQEKKGEKAATVKSEPIGSIGAPGPGPGPGPGAAPEQGGPQPAAYEYGGAERGEFAVEAAEHAIGMEAGKVGGNMSCY